MDDNNTSQEIDLLYILKGIKKGLDRLGRDLKNLIQLVRKNVKLLIVCGLIGAGVGMAMFLTSKPIYKAEVTLSHTRLNNMQCANLVNGLTTSLSKDILVKKLNINHNMAMQIKSITYKPLISVDRDSLLKISDFKIEVKVKDPIILDSLQIKLLNYLESNEYASKRKAINEIYLDKFEEKIKIQILSIDSLRRIVDKSILPRSLGNGIILGESIDPVKVYQEGMSLYQSQLKIDEARQLNNSFEVVVGFAPTIASLGIVMHTIIGLIIGSILGLLLLFRKTVK